MNGAEITMLSLSIIAIVSSVSAIGSFSRSRIRMLTEKNKYIDENIKPYIDSLDYNELLVVANAMINSLSDDEANVFQNDIENIDLFLCDDENFNEVVCEKLRDLIEEKNQVLMVENIIKSKGVEDIVIVLTNSQKANVIVKAEEITESLAAQIMQTIVDQLNIDVNNITIENVNM